MLVKNVSYIANYLWQKSMENIDHILSKEEKEKFNVADYYYLTTIYYMDKPNFGDVSSKLGLTKPAISALIKRLEVIGFIQKQQSPEDKRIFYLELTEKGKKVVEGDNSLYLQFGEVIQSIVTKEQMEEVECLFEQVAEILKSEVAK